MLLNKPLDETVIRAQSTLTDILYSIDRRFCNGTNKIFFFVSRKLFQIENQWLNEPNL